MNSFTRITAATAASLAALAGPVDAQYRTGDGFMFGAPRGSLSVFGGFALATAGSDLFSFTTNQLTVNKLDFSGGSAGGDVAWRVSPRFDVFAGASWSGRIAQSEFRDWVDQNDNAIRQTTRFTRVPITAGFKAYLLPRGRAVGRYAWIPSRFTAYVGAAGGVVWYEFHQNGDFVDFETLAVFTDEFQSRGVGPAAQGLAGMEVSVTSRFSLMLEGRYTLAQAKLGRDFTGFDPIDLSGGQATAGMSARF